MLDDALTLSYEQFCASYGTIHKDVYLLIVLLAQLSA